MNYAFFLNKEKLSQMSPQYLRYYQQYLTQIFNRPASDIEEAVVQILRPRVDVSNVQPITRDDIKKPGEEIIPPVIQPVIPPVVPPVNPPNE